MLLRNRRKINSRNLKFHRRHSNRLTESATLSRRPISIRRLIQPLKAPSTKTRFTRHQITPAANHKFSFKLNRSFNNNCRHRPDLPHISIKISSRPGFNQACKRHHPIKSSTRIRAKYILPSSYLHPKRSKTRTSLVTRTLTSSFPTIQPGACSRAKNLKRSCALLTGSGHG